MLSDKKSFLKKLDIIFYYFKGLSTSEKIVQCVERDKLKRSKRNAYL
jgi:hypothetical protein